MRLQDDRPGVTSEELRTLAVPGVDIDVELLARGKREGGHVRRIEGFTGFALRLVPCAPDGKELAQAERVVRRRLDVDDVLVGGVHVQPVEAGGRRLAAL